MSIDRIAVERRMLEPGSGAIDQTQWSEPFGILKRRDGFYDPENFKNEQLFVDASNFHVCTSLSISRCPIRLLRQDQH